jgi:hypothetical protein
MRRRDLPSVGIRGRKERVEPARRRKNSLKEEVAWRSSMGGGGCVRPQQLSLSCVLSLSLSLSFCLFSLIPLDNLS